MQKIGLIILALALVLGVTYKVTQSSRHSTDGVTNGQSTDPSANPATAQDANKAANQVAAQNGQANGQASDQQTDQQKNSVQNGKSISTNGSNGSSNGAAGSHGTAATTLANGASTTGNATAVKPTEAVKENNCFAYEYHHGEAAQGKDIEDYLDYTNAFPVAHGPVNAKSICVKVNQKPVKFKVTQYKGQQEIQIGSVVGPESVIRVSYCVGAAPCKEACAVKANRFLDDLSAENEEGDAFKDSWDGANGAKKKELEANTKEFRSIASKSEAISNQSVIREWETLKKQEWFCTK